MVSTTELFAGRFRLGPLLGQGGMSDVYRAEDERDGGTVALKIVRSGDPELARRLDQEVKVHRRMVHEGLIRLLDTGVADGQAFLVMELVEGATLAASLRSGPLGARLTAKLGHMLGGALAYVHAEGIVHRDVKPSNIMLASDGRALLGDFGIARLLDATAFTVDGTTIGTVAYMAPEQLEDHQVTPSADIWSLGMVLLECLTGRRSYEGTSSEIIARRLAGPVPLPVDLPTPWKLLLSGMLDHRPEQRLDGGQVASMLSAPAYAVPWTPGPQKAADTAVLTSPLDLTALAPGHQSASAATQATPPVVPAEATRVGVPPVPPPARGGDDRRARRRAWLMGLAVAVVLAAAVGTVYALTATTSPSAPPAHHATTTTTTTSTTTTSTTTTTLPTGPTALAALVRDVASGVDAGTVNPSLGQALTSRAQQAVSDVASGQPDKAANDLQQAAGTIADGTQNGGIDPSEASVLQSDLSALASTLGLGAAGQAPTTTTTTTTPVVGKGGKHHRGNEGG